MVQIFKRQMERLCQLFVGGFLEAMYSINEKGDTTYAQINAKLVDYDTIRVIPLNLQNHHL